MDEKYLNCIIFHKIIIISWKILFYYTIVIYFCHNSFKLNWTFVVIAKTKTKIIFGNLNAEIK